MGAMGDEPGETSGDDARKELGEALLKDTREELGRADGKAAMLMSASGVVVSVLLAGAIAGKWDPTELGHWQWLWWPGAAAGAIGIVAFAAAVWPRDVHKNRRRSSPISGTPHSMRRSGTSKRPWMRKPYLRRRIGRRTNCLPSARSFGVSSN